MLEDAEEEKQVKITLGCLDKNFSNLMVVVRSSLDHKLEHQQLVLVDFIRWIEHRMKWVGELSNIVDLNELFKKLHPYFDFIDCELIVDMSEKFLNNELFGEDKRSLVSELKEHIAKANTLRCSLTVKQLKNQLKTIYFPHIRDLSNMPQIQIELHNPWSEATIEGLYLLVRHLLPHKLKQSLLEYITIDTGSIIIKYIVHESNPDCLIAYAQSKLQFMRLIGIFGLTINGEHILEEDENMNFTFESALHEAVKAGHNEAIQFLLKLGGDVDHCNEKQMTALMIASESGYEQIVLTLISAGSNVNIQNNEGWTALMIASQNGHTQVVEQLLKENADVNIQNKESVTALMKASEKGHTEVVEQLLKEHADVNIQNKNGCTALIIASQNGHIQVIKQLFQVHPDVNIQTNNGWTALMIASQNGHTQVVEQLLKEHAEVNVQNKEGVTALTKASEKGHTEVVEQLLKENADVNIQNKNGWTALMMASQNGHTEVVEQLLKEHADVNIQNNDGWTALIIASQNRHTQIVEQLLKVHADVNIQDNEGWTALMIASQNDHTQVVEQLLKEHADLNIQDNEGWTTLMVVSQNGHTQIIEQLLKEHPDVNIQNKNGSTALMIASANGHTQVVELLAKELVDIDVQMKDGSTALMLACYYGHLEVAECLLQSFAEPHIIDYNGSTAFSLAAYNGNRDLVNMLLDKAEPTTDEIEKAVITSCYGGHPTLITFLSNNLPHLTNDQRELLDSCVKGDLGAVIMKTLDSPDTPLVIGLTPLMVASSCGHVNIVDALIQAGADVNKQESHLGLTPLFFAVSSSNSSSIIQTLLMYGAHPNVIADNNMPLDVVNKETIRELLISYGCQTISQLQRKKEYELSELQSPLQTLGEVKAMANLLTHEDEMKDKTTYEESSYTFNMKKKEKTSEIQSFISLLSSFT